MLEHGTPRLLVLMLRLLVHMHGVASVEEFPENAIHARRRTDSHGFSVAPEQFQVRLQRIVDHVAASVARTQLHVRVFVVNITPSRVSPSAAAATRLATNDYPLGKFDLVFGGVDYVIV